MKISLEDISGIGKATADRMKAAGINSIQKLAKVKPDELLSLNIKGIGETTAIKYIEQAKEMYEEISDKKDNRKSKQKLLSQKEEKKTAKTIKDKTKKPIPNEGIAKLKEQNKSQAECNIGLVGHVDHGMIMSSRHFP